MRIRSIGRRSLGRLAVALSAAMVVTVGTAALSAPQPTIATPPSSPVPVGDTAVRTDLEAGLAWNAPISIGFSTPMNRSSVAASLRIEPATTVDMTWNQDGTTLVVSPRSAWQAGTLHTVTVGQGTLAANGDPLTAPVRAAFLTRPASPASIAPTKAVGTTVSVDSTFALLFDRDVDGAALSYSLKIDPPVPGTVERVGRRSGVSYFFVPASPLAPDTAYRLLLVPSGPAADAASATTISLAVRTAKTPRVVRLRPADKSTRVDRGSVLSVRFSEPMDQASVREAFSVTAGGRRVPGTIQFAERGTVLSFSPTAALGGGQKVVMTVSTAARSVVGGLLARPVTAAFTTSTAAARLGPRLSSGAAPPPSDGFVGSGTWAAVEAYYLTLMNCTRTGGWVTSSGSCSSPGGRAVAPLWIDSGISANVSRPYARLLATRNICNHFIGGTPGDRLRRAGYTSYIWGENLGCRSGNPMTSVLGSHLFFQAEKPCSSCHYANLMNAQYDRVGLGVWVASGRVRLVIDFYHPR